MRDRADHFLMVLLVRSDRALDEIVTGLLDAGVTDATVVDAKSLSTVLQQDMPIFAGLGAMLPKSSAHRVVLALVAQDAVDHLERFVSEMHESDRPLTMVLDVHQWFGGA